MLMQQPAFVPFVFIAFQSDEAQRRFPGLDAPLAGEATAGFGMRAPSIAVRMRGSCVFGRSEIIENTHNA